MTSHTRVHCAVSSPIEPLCCSGRPKPKVWEVNQTSPYPIAGTSLFILSLLTLTTDPDSAHAGCTDSDSTHPAACHPAAFTLLPVTLLPVTLCLSSPLTITLTGLRTLVSAHAGTSPEWALPKFEICVQPSSVPESGNGVFVKGCVAAVSLN